MADFWADDGWSLQTTVDEKYSSLYSVGPL